MSAAHTERGASNERGAAASASVAANVRRLSGRHARLLALLLLAVSVRVLYVFSTSPESPIGSTDAWGYHRLALNLDRGNGFSLRREAPFVPDSVRTPLYPIFLLIVRRTLGPPPQTAALIHAFLDGITALLTWRLAVGVHSAARGRPSAPHGDAHSRAARRAGHIAALLYALNPAQVRYVNELLAETLLSFLLTLCVCVLVRYVTCSTHSPHGGATRCALLLGALGGLAALCKPNVQFLPLVWLLAMMLSRGQDRRQRWRDASVMVTTLVGVLLPWIARNYLVFGRPFLSTAFEGNISRVSAPATLITARGEYAIPWSTEWEAAFSELVSQAATRYRWDKPWDALSARELDAANRQVYLAARQILCQHPLAWLGSHLQGMVRYMEPQTYRACYVRFVDKAWPPDVLDDALIHALRAIGRDDWAGAVRIVTQERWNKLDPLQRTLWWGTFLGQVIGSILVLRGAWRLRRQPGLAVAVIGTISYVLWMPGPIAYERFRVPVLSTIVTLAVSPIGVSASPRGAL